ncbi:NmrA/HSCARG family protein [Streptomyces flavidovirens]|uniref:NmrA/HSCARG family protein n=1 Tax=Streptomyces flavidovirens TaxID=67298 RepID=UPI0036C9A005
MAEKKIIAVFGATGSQGGGLARAVLSEPDGDFAVRALTRNPASEASRELERLGAEVVRADLDDESSLGPALEGAYGAFVVTNFWEHLSGEREKTQAAAAARAAGHVGVQHAIWSSLDDTRECIPLDDDRMPTLEGSYKVPHFDAKAEADSYFSDAGVPTTLLKSTFFWENLLSAAAPQRGEDGVLQLSLPMGDRRLAGMAVDDIGKIALAVLKHGGDMVGATVSVAGEHLPIADMAEILTEAVGEPVAYRPLSPDAFRALGFPGAEESGNMFQYYADCESRITAARDLTALRALNPELQDFATWVAGHREELRAACK